MHTPSTQTSALNQVNDQLSRLSQSIERISAKLSRTEFAMPPTEPISFDRLYPDNPIVPDDRSTTPKAGSSQWVGLFQQIDKATTDLTELRASLDWVVGGQDLFSRQGWWAGKALKLNHRKSELLHHLPRDIRDLAWSTLLSLLVAHEKGQTLSKQELCLSLGVSDEAIKPALTQLQCLELIWQAGDKGRVGLQPGAIRSLYQILD